MTASRSFAFALVTAVALAAAALAQAQQTDQGSKSSAQAAASSPSASPPAAARSAAETDASAAQSAKAAAAEKKAAEHLIKDARNAGFKPVVMRGTQMFCRTAVELGSSFPVRTCYDSHQVKIKIHEYAEQRSQLEHLRSVGQPP